MENLFKQYPNEFLDQCKKKLGARNDHQFCALTGIDTSVVTKIRHGRFGISPGFLITMHCATGWSIAELRTLLYQREFPDDAFLSPKVRKGLAVQIKPFEQRIDNKVKYAKRHERYAAVSKHAVQSHNEGVQHKE